MKYPRTYHLPNSPGFSSDDKKLKIIDHFIGKEVIYTEKLDGECTSFLYNKIHARSEESSHHNSQAWIKNLYSTISYKIPKNLQIVGESTYAKHSIFYDNLTTYFYVFAVIDIEKEVFLSVDDTISITNELGLKYVPILYKGLFDENFKLPTKSAFGEEIEGFVVRIIGEFAVNDMNKSVAKYVRQNHVTTDKHWKKTWIPNKLS